MKYVYLALNWFFGVTFLLLGVLLVFSDPLLGIPITIIGLLLLPPLRRFVYSKTNKELPSSARAGIIVVLFIGLIIIQMVKNNEAERIAAIEIEQQNAEKAEIERQEELKRIAIERQQDLDYFKQNSALVIDQVEEALAKGNFDEAIALSAKYLDSENADIIALNAKAKEAQNAIERETKTKEILAQLKTIPAHDTLENLKLYKQLVSLNPDVPAYAKKLKHYEQQDKKERLDIEKTLKEIAAAKAKKDRENRERRIKFGPIPARSKWDGSYYAVESYLKMMANDPRSIKIEACTEVFSTDKGWLVGCDYRGKNAFNATVLQSNWFTIVHDTVIQVEDSSAYKQ